MCIDQENLAERNFHVQLMGRIYDHASSTIVWLGVPSSDRTEIRAMDFIKEIVTMSKRIPAEKLAQSLLNPECEHRWHTLLRMCRHSYWSRTWIIQEFVRAPSIEVICGNASIAWNQFEVLLDLLSREPYLSHRTITPLFRTRPARLTSRRQMGRTDTLYELLLEFHDSQCKERRDKVYGILGLASDCVRQSDDLPESIKADYKKHIVEVYFDTVVCMKDSLGDGSLIPSAANLARRALLLTQADFASYVSSQSLQLPLVPVFTIRSGYTSTVQNLGSWTSVSSLRQLLNQTDWGDFVGYEVKGSARPNYVRRSSRITHSTLPDDLIQNVINAAETEDLNCLYNYSCTGQLHIPFENMFHHEADRRLFENEKMLKPPIFLEQCATTGNLRVGFACTNTRNGDRVLQFPGLDCALIVRQIGFETRLIGKAVLVKHCQSVDEYSIDRVCESSNWISACPKVSGGEVLEIETDALSLPDLLSRG